MLNLSNWSVLWEPVTRQSLIDALLMTCAISGLSWFFSMILGVGIGLLREMPVAACRLLASSYVEVFRNIPLLVQLFFIYYILPRALPDAVAKVLFNFGWEVVAAVITLSLYTSAKIAEYVRAGFNTVGARMQQAAAASGLTWWQAQRHIFLGLVLRTSLPSLVSEFVTIFKGSSLAMTVGVAETTYVTRQIGADTFQWFQTNLFATAVYLLCAWVIAGLMSLVERRLRIPGRIGS
jgi:glutamate/aspartate transport system permease protein